MDDQINRFFKVMFHPYLAVFFYVTLLRGMVLELRIMPTDHMFIYMIPFHSIRSIQYVADCAVQSGYPLQDILPTIIWENIRGLVFNMILFIPFGFLVPIVYEKYRKWKKIILLSITVAFIKEGLKIVFSFLGMMYGRRCNIDNIPATLIGTVLGYLLLQGVLKLLKLFSHKTKDKIGPHRFYPLP